MYTPKLLRPLFAVVMTTLLSVAPFAQSTPDFVFETPSPVGPDETFCDVLVDEGLLPAATEGFIIDAVAPNPFPYGSSFEGTVFGQSTTITVERTIPGDDRYLSFTSSNPDLGVDAAAIWGNADGAVATAYVFDDELDGVAQSGEGLHNGGFGDDDAALFYHIRLCFAPAAPPPPPPCDGGDCFETSLLDSADNGDGTYTYTFETCKIDSFCRGFSFVAIEIPEGASVLSANRSYDSNSNGRYDPDYDFIKFEVGGGGNVGHCEAITFTLDQPYTTDEIAVRVKFGRTAASNKDKVDDYTVNLLSCVGDAAELPSASARTSGSLEQFELSPAYPNPLRGAATLTLRADESTFATVVVYDVLGREVARLVDGIIEAGSYDLRWDAQDLPSGTYIALLRVGSTTQTQVMTVAR